MTRLHLNPTLLKYYNAFEQGDFNAFVGCYADDLWVEDVLWKQVWTSREVFTNDNTAFFDSLDFAKFYIEEVINSEANTVVNGCLSARFHNHMIYNRVPFSQTFRFDLKGNITRERAFIAHTEEMLNRHPDREDRVIELVVFKIKEDHLSSYHNSLIVEWRQLVKQFDGFIAFRTLQSETNKGLMVDYVEWQNLWCAQRAAEQIKQLQNEQEYAHLFEAFEEIKMFDHFKPLTS